MDEDTKHLVDIIKISSKKNRHIYFVPLPDENHLTILHNSVYKAFETLYPKKPVKKR